MYNILSRKFELSDTFLYDIISNFYILISLEENVYFNTPVGNFIICYSWKSGIGYLPCIINDVYQKYRNIWAG